MSPRQKMTKILRLTMGLGGLGFVWLVILPKVADLPFISRHISAMEAKGIEVDAMFYTELNWEPPPNGTGALDAFKD